MLMGSVVALFVENPLTIFRNDGSRVLIPRQTSFWREIKNVPLSIKREPLIILFFSYAFAGRGTYRTKAMISMGISSI
jgi:hypothetical protein